MKKNKGTRAEEPDILAEYDFSGGVRGKYAARFAEGTNVVLLDPDVAELFPSSESVNTTLREIVKVAHQQAKRIEQGGRRR